MDLSLICAPVMRPELAAPAVPPSATKSAIIASTIAGVSRFFTFVFSLLVV